MLTEATDSLAKATNFGGPPDRIIVFSRYALPGQAKTRLISAIGAEKAAELQVQMSRQTINMAREFCSSLSCEVEVRFAGGDADLMANQIGVSARYVAQVGIHLGERLTQAVENAFREGTQRVVVVGADCPELNREDLQNAFQSLLNCDVVLGPARDGGYYLIGLKTNRPQLFQGIEWGSEWVLNQTLARAKAAKLRVGQLPIRSDVDHPEDLLICRRMAPLFAEVLPKTEPGLLSIIIPTRNEASGIERTLSPLVSLPHVEILVADGGSEDATVEIARSLGVRVIRTRPGRGSQMNVAAAQAQGEALLFLHADTRLPANFQKHVWEILAQGAIAGAFRLRIDDRRALLRVVEWGANLRSRVRQMPYGDQGLFLKAETFYQLGGFPNWPLMEDYEFCRRLRRRGKIRLACASVMTSARRWKRLGVIRTTLRNQLCIAAYLAGISPQRLARWYALGKRS